MDGLAAYPGFGLAPFARVGRVKFTFWRLKWCEGRNMCLESLSEKYAPETLERLAIDGATSRMSAARRLCHAFNYADRMGLTPDVMARLAWLIIRTPLPLSPAGYPPDKSAKLEWEEAVWKVWGSVLAPQLHPDTHPVDRPKYPPGWVRVEPRTPEEARSWRSVNEQIQRDRESYEHGAPIGFRF